MSFVHNHFIFILSLILIGISLDISAQINGYVYDVDGVPIIGANIVLKERSDIGTISDIDGFFVLNENPPQILLVSYLGYQIQEVEVASLDTINIILQQDAVSLDEVVVTALGIKKSEKSLGYATQSISGSNIDKATDPNFLNKLSGQVAGLQISPSSNGPGGSARILIRGSSSLTGEDQPIFVIDGIVVSNSAGNGATSNGGLDYGNAMSNINPDDIETITVLKGPGAAALYGSLGQNGAIVITTKSGTGGKGVGINFSTSNTIEQPFLFPAFQNEFGRGARGVFTPFNQSSWGPRYDGRNVTNWKDEEINYEPQTEQMSEFFQLGANHSNNLEITGGNEQSNTRLSFSTLRYNNTIPNSNLKRNAVSLRNKTEVAGWLSFDTKVNYINQSAFNRLNLAGSPDNPVRSFYIMPRSVRLANLQPYINESGLPILWDGRTSGSFDQNPYWAINLNTNNDVRNRIISAINLQFNFLPWLSGHVRAGGDYILDRRSRQVAENTAYKVSPDASLIVNQSERYTGNYDFLLKADHSISRFDISLSVGGNRLEQTFNGLNGFGDALNNPDLYVINNFVETFASQGISRKRINSVYAFTDVDFSDFLYLNLTARNDWSSALPSENRSFFYSSANLSWVLTETWVNSFPSFLDFAKVRFSYANVGNDTNPHRLDFIYASSTGHLGQPFTRLPRERPPLDLLPENTRSFEAGIDLRTFGGKFNLDFTIYQSNTFNQIFAAPVASSSGFERALINSGEMQNKGIELQVSTAILPYSSPLSWDIDMNFSILVVCGFDQAVSKREYSETCT